MDRDEILAFGYSSPRLLPTGEWAGLLRMIFTYALVVGIDEIGYRTRYCYARQTNAEMALEIWDGTGDPPGPWIKKKGGEEKLGPGATE